MSGGVVDHTAQSVAEMLRLHAHDDCGEKYLDTHACNIAAVFVEAQAARNAELEARLKEMTRRRDKWRKEAEGFDTIRHALREKVGAPWPPHLSRALWAALAADEKKRADDAEAQLARAREAELEEAASHTALMGELEDAQEALRVIAYDGHEDPSFVAYAYLRDTAIRALATPQEGESVIRKSTELLTDNNRISGESDV